VPDLAIHTRDLTRDFGALRAVDGLIERAKADGALRSDFVPEDLVLLLLANAGVVQGAGEAAPDAWRRFVGLVLDGCRSEGAGPLPSPPTPRQVMRAMRRLTRTPIQPRSRP